MSPAPRLSREDIAAEVQRYFESERARSLIALFGTGDECTVESEASGPLPVIPVGSELELRRRLLDLTEEKPKAVFLVPWRQQLPLDLAGRFALDGQVRSIGREERLKRLFGVPLVAAEALASPLAEHLLAHPPEVKLATGDAELTEPRMWEVWLSRVWGLDTSGGLALDSLLAWAALDGRGAAFERSMEGTPELREALEAFLARTLGPAAPVVFDAWQRGRGEELLCHAVVFDALRGNDAVRLWVRGQVRSALGVESDEHRERIAAQLGEAVSTALPLYASAAARDRKDPLRALLERADQLVDDREVKAALVSSARLPSAWRLRLDALGEALADAATKPDRAALRAVLAAKDQVQAHASYRDDEHDREVQRAEMAVRLLAWLASDRSGLDPGVAEPAHADVERLGRWYVEQGGFVDWARRVARGSATTAFDRGAQAIVHEADALREKLDMRFARALASWVEARRPAHQVVPIDQVSKRIVAPFLAGHPERKLLVLLLDGMAWAQAVEILESLGARADGWGPAAWHAQGRKLKLGDARLPVVLAALPTVTEISRAAFFAGKDMPVGKVHDTKKDVERWRDNRELAPFFEGAEYPRLFLRSTGHEVHGVASREVLTAIGQSDQPVVAAVINAIDASLKGDPQQWHPWKADSIRSLPELLAAAKEHGRTVLLASDHGHVPSDRFVESAGASTGGARWRPLERADDPVADYEVRLRGEGVWRPKGAEAVALLADDKRRYGGGAHAGEHGGATLAEVVAPCVLAQWDDPYLAQVDPDRAVQGLTAPPWWHFDVPEPVMHAPASPTPVRPKRSAPKPAVPENQLAFDEFPLKVAEPTPAASPASASAAAERNPALDALGELPTLKALGARERSQVLDAVDYLLRQDGIAGTAAFASHMGLPSFRVPGFIAQRLQRVLNLDGFQVITYDQSQVRLDRAVLEQQFGVTL